MLFCNVDPITLQVFAVYLVSFVCKFTCKIFSYVFVLTDDDELKNRAKYIAFEHILLPAGCYLRTDAILGEGRPFFGLSGKFRSNGKAR